jgi:hypothetical protein
MGDATKTVLELLIEQLPSVTPGGVPIKTGAKLGLALISSLLKRQDEMALDEFLGYLANQTGNISQMLSDPWLRSREGGIFWGKVFSSAMNAQIADKRELFANALVNGLANRGMPELKRLKFVDLLRSLSKASLMCLAEIHAHCAEKLSESGGEVGTPGIKINQLPLSSASDRYYTESVVQELHSAGIFSSAGKGWRSYEEEKNDVSPSSNLFYTDFSREFSEFITAKKYWAAGLEE